MTDKLSEQLHDALFWLLNLLHNVSKWDRDPQTDDQANLPTDEEWGAALEAGEEAHKQYIIYTKGV